MSKDLLMTKRQVAERLSVSVRTIERMVATEKLRAVPIRGCVRFLESEVEKLIWRPL